MKTIGLIGGMSWESSLEYYRLINEQAKALLGDIHSAKILMYSFDFAEVEKLQHELKWDELEQQMVDVAMSLKNAGADFIVICTNTMHMFSDVIEKKCDIEVLHIAKATSDSIMEKHIETVLLLGTKFTMEGTFYKDILNHQGINVVIPNESDRMIVHNVIYNELVQGKIKEASKKEYIRIIEESKKQGVAGVVLGCTEIPLLIKDDDVSVSVFDTTEIHSIAAMQKALGE